MLVQNTVQYGERSVFYGTQGFRLLVLQRHGPRNDAPSTPPLTANYAVFHKFCAARRKTQERARAGRARLNKVVLPLPTKHDGRGEAYASKTKPRCRNSLERQKNLVKFDIAASTKNRQARSNTVLERGRAPYWRTSVVLTGLHGTAETKCRTFCTHPRR